VDELGGLKRAAAEEAVARYVESGMVVGLGSGSTAAYVVRRIGELLASGEIEGVVGVPTSSATTTIAAEVGIPLASLSEVRPRLTIDGTDEITPQLDLIKGRGGALLREKIVASAGEEGMVVVADATKRVENLGAGPLPVEVEPFGWEATMEALEALGCRPERRMDAADPSRPFVTDGGHFTADCLFRSIDDPAALEREIRAIPGALECGLFVGLTRAAVIAREDGSEVLEA
jgi:ribose 5-phosphate isomerase A